MSPPPSRKASAGRGQRDDLQNEFQQLLTDRPNAHVSDCIGSNSATRSPHALENHYSFNFIRAFNRKFVPSGGQTKHRPHSRGRHGLRRHRCLQPEFENRYSAPRFASENWNALYRCSFWRLHLRPFSIRTADRTIRDPRHTRCKTKPNDRTGPHNHCLASSRKWIRNFDGRKMARRL